MPLLHKCPSVNLPKGMDMKRSIVWLASYPKSGNTWTRVFLANYLSNAQEPLSINRMQMFAMGDSVPKLYQIAAGREIDTTDAQLTVRLRPRVLQGLVANNADVNFVKTHNFRSSVYGVELFPTQVTRQAIYIVRNPLDVVMSFSRHFGMTIEDTVDAFAKSDFASGADSNTTWQFLGSWSDHVKSWTKGASFPVLVIRYEDLLEDPVTHFGSIVDALGIPVEDDRLRRAIHFSRFDELKKQEEKQGFKEGPGTGNLFFNTGKTGQWKEHLDPTLISKIRRDHKRIMKQFRYYNA